MSVLGGVNPGEDGGFFRIVCVDQLIVYDLVFILSFGVNGSSFLLVHDARRKIVAVEQGTIIILLAFYVTDKTDDVYRVIVADYWLCVGCNNNQLIRSISY